MPTLTLALLLLLAAAGQSHSQSPKAKKQVTDTQGSAGELKRRIDQALAALAKPEPKQALQLLRAFAPDEHALTRGLTPAGKRRLQKRILAAGQRRFAGTDPKAIAERMRLVPGWRATVLVAPTEDLAAMPLGTDAAREFASGLRRTARLLKPKTWWFVVRLDDPKSKRHVRTQVWLHHKGRYVLLGRLWRFDPDDA